MGNAQKSDKKTHRKLEGDPKESVILMGFRVESSHSSRAGRAVNPETATRDFAFRGDEAIQHVWQLDLSSSPEQIVHLFPTPCHVGSLKLAIWGVFTP